jgi:large conductance mechanosensitive channel
MGFLQDFKAFAMRGNVVDLAVGVIIGGAFGAIVTSLVNDIIMPPVGALTRGGQDLKTKFITLDGGTYRTLDEAKKASAAIIAWGPFLSNVINFVIIAFVIFLLVRAMARLLPPPPPPPPPGPTPDQQLLTEIRDLLAKGALPPASK